MKIDWTMLLATLGASSICLSVMAFLLKAIINNRLARDLERFKGELEHREQINNIRFSRLHERQAEVIHNLYQRIMRFRTLCFALLTPGGDEAVVCRDFDNVGQIARALLEINQYFGENALYLPKRLREKYRSLFTVGIIGPLKAIGLMAATDSVLKEFRPEWRKEVVESLVPTMKAEVAQIDGYIADLEVEFQRVIGISGVSSIGGREEE